MSPGFQEHFFPGTSRLFREKPFSCHNFAYAGDRSALRAVDSWRADYENIEPGEVGRSGRVLETLLRVLLVEDEPTLADALVEALEYDSYAVDHAADGESASELADVNSYDAIILDWEIPEPSGIQLLEGWRAAGLQTPILMLTGRSGVQDRVGGLDTGADDYLTKPFSVSELLARVRSLLRRRDKELQMTLSAGDLEMDRSAHRVTVGGRNVTLTPKEFALLEYFLHNVGRVVTRTAISEHVWDDSFDSFANVIDVTVHRLRRKVDGDREDKLLHTVKGVGYVLQPEREVPG